jgi:hypothetical protein
LPSAAVCHAEWYNADQCAVARSSWLDSFWRTNQTGSYSATLWEMGPTGQCFVDTAAEAPCDQGVGMTWMNRLRPSLLISAISTILLRSR